MMTDSEEIAKLVDGAYRNILEKFNPCARQLISAGKAYLKALHGAVAASKTYIDSLSKLARNAHQGTWGGCTDIGTALLLLVDIQKEIQSQQINILKAFYVDLLVPLESNIDKDTKIVASEQKRFLQQHKCLQESYLKAATTVKKQRKKNKASRGGHLDKEIKTLQQLEEEKLKLDTFSERSLKLAITQERRRYGFVLERQCSLVKHNLLYHSQGQSLLEHHLEDWEEAAKSREVLPEPINKLFPTANIYNCGEYASSNILADHHTSLYNTSPRSLKKARSIDTSCVDIRNAPDLPFSKTLIRAKSDFNIASSTASLASNEYSVALRPKSLVEPNSSSGRVRANYSYLSSGEHQLSFHEGDVILLIGHRNKGWHYGENQRNRRRGWFPIAYTTTLKDDFIDDENSGNLGSEVAYSSVSRSRTTPDMHHADTPTSSSSEGTCSLPPPPPTLQRPLSTFVDVKSLDIVQAQRPNFFQPAPNLCSDVGAAPSPTTPSAVTGDPRPPAPRRLPPIIASLHSSSDSGFGSENPPPAPPIAPSKFKDNVFSSVKLRKVVTNDRSAPIIS